MKSKKQKLPKKEINKLLGLLKKLNKAQKDVAHMKRGVKRMLRSGV